MALGLSSTLSKTGFTNPVAGIVTDSLVMKHNYAAGGVVPVSDGAALFDASSEVITCGNDTSMDITDDITMTAWVNPTTAGQNAHIVGRDDGTNRNYALFVNSNAYIFDYFVSGSAHRVTSSTADTPSVWVHLACTRDKSSGTNIIYVNGVAEDTDTDSTASIDNDDVQFSIGARPAPASPFAGYICNVGLWSGVLTQAQIKSIMWKNYEDLTSSDKDAGTTGSSNIVAWWNLDAEVGSDGNAGSGYVLSEVAGAGSTTNLGTLT